MRILRFLIAGIRAYFAARKRERMWEKVDSADTQSRAKIYRAMELAAYWRDKREREAIMRALRDKRRNSPVKRRYLAGEDYWG